MEEKMTPHEARAAELFLSGAVCAQAVFCAFSDLHGLDFEIAAKLSSSMGGGVGRLREVCGAFSGAAMAAGLLYGFAVPPAQGEKSEHYKRIQLLASRFSAFHFLFIHYHNKETLSTLFYFLVIFFLTFL